MKWRELEEQRKAERLHKRLQQEQAYLLSLQHDRSARPPPQPTADQSQELKKPPHTPSPDAGPADPAPAMLPTAPSHPNNPPVKVPSDRRKSLKAEPLDTGDTQSPAPDRPAEPDESPAPPPDCSRVSPSQTPLTESLDCSREAAEPVSQPPQPIREVNLRWLVPPSPFSFSVYPAACCNYLPLTFSTQ